MFEAGKRIGNFWIMLGQRLKSLRTQMGYSRQRLAELLDIGEAQIPRYESDETKPSSDVVIRMSKLFGVSADYLLGLSDDPHGYYEGNLSSLESHVIHALRNGSSIDAIRVIVTEG